MWVRIPPPQLENCIGGLINPLIVYWSGNSRGTERVAQSLKTRTLTTREAEGTTGPFIAMVPTYDQPRGGFTPKPMERFISHQEDLYPGSLIGVIGTGNLNFQQYFCQAAKDIAKKYGVPVLHRVDVMGTGHDYQIIDKGVQEHWETLCRMRREAMSSN